MFMLTIKQLEMSPVGVKKNLHVTSDLYISSVDKGPINLVLHIDLRKW